MVTLWFHQTWLAGKSTIYRGFSQLYYITWICLRGPPVMVDVPACSSSAFSEARETSLKRCGAAQWLLARAWSPGRIAEKIIANVMDCHGLPNKYIYIYMIMWFVYKKYNIYICVCIYIILILANFSGGRLAFGFWGHNDMTYPNW